MIVPKSPHLSPLERDVLKIFEQNDISVTVLETPLNRRCFRVSGRESHLESSESLATYRLLEIFVKALWCSKDLLDSQRVPRKLSGFFRVVSEGSFRFDMEIIPRTATSFTQVWRLPLEPFPPLNPKFFLSESKGADGFSQTSFHETKLSMKAADADLIEVITEIAAQSHPPLEISALDLGCGNDVASSFLCNLLGAKVLSVDHSLQAQEQWKKLSSQLPPGRRSFVLADLEQFIENRATRQKKFSFIYSRNALHFFSSIEKIQKILGHIFASLHPGGTVSIRVGTDALVLGEVYEGVGPENLYGPPVWFFKGERYLEALRAVGFSSVRYKKTPDENFQYLTILATKSK